MNIPMGADVSAIRVSDHILVRGILLADDIIRQRNGVLVRILPKTLTYIAASEQVDTKGLI